MKVDMNHQVNQSNDEAPVAKEGCDKGHATDPEDNMW